MRQHLRAHALLACSIALAAAVTTQAAHAGKIYLMGGGYSDTRFEYLEYLRNRFGIFHFYNLKSVGAWFQIDGCNLGRMTLG